MGKECERHFSKEDIKMANKYMLICSNIVIKLIQLLSYQLKENINQNDNEISLYTHQESYYQRWIIPSVGENVEDWVHSDIGSGKSGKGRKYSCFRKFDSFSKS